MPAARIISIIIIAFIAAHTYRAEANAADTLKVSVDTTLIADVETDVADTPQHKPWKPTLYDYPYSRTRSLPQWGHLWANTALLVSAGAATMGILEALPADATAWNKSENAKRSMWSRYWHNIHQGPVWDKDNLVFNLILHPYGGAAYYMAARGAGFNMWGSMLYSVAVSTLFWEYGLEAFNEIPSVQDLVITPLIGSLMGEGFYLIKRHIVRHGYRLWGSKVLGYVVAFLVDPLNEVTGYLRGDQRKLSRHFDQLNNVPLQHHLQSSAWLQPSVHRVQAGLSISYIF